MTPPLAHETWFVESGPYPTEWGFAGQTTTLLLLVAALGLTVAVRLLAGLRNGLLSLGYYPWLAHAPGGVAAHRRGPDRHTGVRGFGGPAAHRPPGPRRLRAAHRPGQVVG